jgi:multiple sugar transport system substrate-binding protein
MEKPQYDNLLESSIGYVTQTLKGFEDNKVWSLDPKTRPFREVVARARPVSYAGKLGYASASVLSDYVVLDMFAEVVAGQKPAKEAMADATKRAERYYKV